MTETKPIQLPPFDFINDILKAGGELYLVGGNVRDHLLDREFKDYDFLVRLISPDTLVGLLKKTGWVNLVGKSFGIYKYRPRSHPDLEIDISLPRLETSTGTGHRDFKVDFDENLELSQDLGRRDFTINAMAINLQTQELIDLYGGKQDLQNKTLKQVFEDSFKQDPLRLIRAVQFAARFGLTIEDITLKSMKDHAELISTVSKERIIEEIRKLFLAEKPSRGFDILRETGMLKTVFPFVQKMIGVLQPMKKNEDVYQHTMKVLDASKTADELEKPGDLDLMFSALLHDAGKPATKRFDAKKNRVSFYGHQIVSKKIARRWLNDYRAATIGLNIPKVLTLVENHMFETKAFYSDKAIRRFVSKLGKDNIYDLIDLRIADKKGGRYPDSMRGILNLRQRIRDELAKKPPFGAKDLLINGHDLMAMGFKPGPLLGQIQKFLVEKVLDEPELNTKEKLTELVHQNFNPDDDTGLEKKRPNPNHDNSLHQTH